METINYFRRRFKKNFMQRYSFITLIIISISLFNSCGSNSKNDSSDSKETKFDSATALIFPGEKHLTNVRQLTFGGDNAEAYFSFDSKKLIFQYTNHKDVMCDQIFMGDIPTDSSQKFNYKLVSTGKGRCTCSYFLPGDSLILFASTHAKVDTCPPVPDKKKLKAYVWPLYNSYEIYFADLRGHIRKQITNNKFYDAEATVSQKGDKIIFTSTRGGDIDLWVMNIDGTNPVQITNTLGYDGGANFSPDGTKIVWRASRPKTEEEIKKYKDFLAMDLVMPTSLQVFVADADGKNVKQVTDLAGANWAPAFSPNGKKIIFASNFEHHASYPFNLYLINIDGTGIEKITESTVFDAFPMFSPNGKYLVFCSNRNDGGNHDTNIFLAEWKD